MKKIFLVLLVVLGLSGAAQAQQFSAGAGLHLAFAGGTSVGFSGFFGSDSALGRNFGLRGTVTLLFDPADLGLGADLYTKIPVDAAVDPYVGGGIALWPVGGFTLEIRALAGLSFSLGRGIALFVETTPGIYIYSGGVAFKIGIAFGPVFRL